MVFVGTKSDLINKIVKGEEKKREVSVDEMKEMSHKYVQKYNSLRHPRGILPIFETSSKLGENVTDVFEYIFETLVPESVGGEKEEERSKTEELVELSPRRSRDVKIPKKCCS